MRCYALDRRGGDRLGIRGIMGRPGRRPATRRACRPAGHGGDHRVQCQTISRRPGPKLRNRSERLSHPAPRPPRSRRNCTRRPRRARDRPRRPVTPAGGVTHGYDRIVLASGSRVLIPAVPGLREFGFDVDTYDAALALQQHLRGLADEPPTPAAATVVVVGAGLTAIETACELPKRLRELFSRANVTPRVILIDRNPAVGSDMGASARPVIERALSDNGVETRTGVSVVTVGERAVLLSSGEQLEAATVVCCAGMRASSLTEQLPAARDRLGP